MPHPRQLIRHAVAAALTGATSAGANVYKTRVLPFRRNGLPAVAVYTMTESVRTDEKSAPRELERRVELVIEGAVQVSSTENADDALDGLALEFETALHADPTFNGTAADSILTSTEIDIAGEGEQMIGVVKLTYEVTYYAYADVGSTLDDFNTANIRHDLGGNVHADNEAVDRVTGLGE